MSRRWIKTSTSLPDWGDEVIVAHVVYDWSNARHKYIRNRNLGVTHAIHWNDGCFTNGGHVVEEVVAWMPLPEPPKGIK